MDHRGGAARASGRAGAAMIGSQLGWAAAADADAPGRHDLHLDTDKLVRRSRGERGVVWDEVRRLLARRPLRAEPPRTME